MQQIIKKKHDNTYNKPGSYSNPFGKSCVRKIVSFMLCLSLLLQMLPTPLFIKQAEAEEAEQTTYEQYLSLGRSILENKKTDFADTAILSGQTISEDTILQGNYTLSGGVLRIDEGVTLTIDGNFAMKKGSLVVKGTLQITGNVWLSDGYVTLSDTIHIEGSCYNLSNLENIDSPVLEQASILTMNQEQAQFIVDGDLLWQGEELLEESKGELVVLGNCALASSQTDYSNVALKFMGDTDQKVAVIAIRNTEEMGNVCEEYVTVKSLTTANREQEKENKKGDKEPVQITMIAPIIVAEELALDYPLTGAIACKEQLLNKLGRYQGDLIIAEKTKLSESLTVEGSLEIAGDVTVDNSITLQITDNLTVVKDAALSLTKALQLTAGGNVNTGTKKINGANNLCLTLNGAKTQSVKMEIKAGEMLKQLTLHNGSKEGIVFETAFPVTEFINKDTVYTMPGQERYGYTLQKDETLDSLTLMGGNLNLNGHTLTIDHDFELAYGQLVMQNAQDVLIVKGDVSLTSKQQQKDSINAGVFCFQGEENQHYKNPATVLQPEWNKVVLANKGTLYLDSDLMVTQELTYQCKQVAGVGVIHVPGFPKHTGKLTGNYCITGDTEWKDTVAVEGDIFLDADFKMTGGSLSCQDITVHDTASLIMEGGSVEVENATVYGDLYMTGDSAELDISGDMKLHTNLLLAKNLSAGTLAVGGSLDNETGKVYATTKVHRTILNQLPGKNGVLQTQKLSMQKASLGSIAHLVLNKRKEYYALNISDDIEALSGDVTYEYTDKNAPEQVSGIKADNITMTGFDVSWDAASDDYGTVGYIVYIDGVKKGETKETKYSFRDLTYRTSYAVSVVAYDTGNNYSDMSESVQVATKNDEEKPTKPAISHDNSTGKAITLSWTKSNDNVGVTGYHVYRDGERIGNVQETEYRDTTAKKGQTYTYHVTAYDEAENESEKSNEVTAALHPIKITNFSCPMVLLPDKENEPAKFTVSAYKKENIKGVSVYYKKQGKEEEQEKEEYQELSEVTPEVTDKGYQISLNEITIPAGSYILRFVATDVDGDEDSRECSFAIDCEPPNKVTGLTMFRRTGSSVVMQWNQGTDNVAVTEYQIYRDGEYLATTPETCYKDSGLKSHEAHSYQILAIDGSGNKGALCDAVEMMPLAPMFLTVTPTDLASVGGKETIFTALFYDTGNSRGNRLYVEYSEDGECYTRINEEGASQQPYRNGVLKAAVTVDLTTLPSKALYIRYILVDEDYNRTTKDVQYVVDTKGAEAPRELKAESVNGVNVLTWQPSVSADCESYAIYRWSEGQQEGEEELLAKVAGKDSVSYEDAKVDEGVLYHYYAIAYDIYGQTEGKSNKVFVKTSRDEEAPIIQGIQPMQISVNKLVTLQASAVDNKKVETIRFLVQEPQGNTTLLAEAAADDKGTASYQWDTTGFSGNYTILLEAVDASGNYSVNEFKKVYLVDNEGPDKPMIQEVIPYQNGLSVSFAYPKAEDYSYMKVQVMKGDKLIKEQKEYNYLNTFVGGLTAGESYQVVLTAYDMLGNASEKSDAVAVTLKADKEPPRLIAQTPKARFVGEQLELSSKATDNEGIVSMKYLISSDQKQWETLYEKEYSDAPKEAELNYTYSVLKQPEGTVYIRVYMLDVEGNESYGKDTISYRIDHTAPNTVTACKAQAAAGQVLLTWEQNEDKDIDCFEVYRAEEGEEGYKQLGTTQSLFYNDSTAKADAVYSYRIRCIDKAGNIGQFSSPVSSGSYEDREAPEIVSMAAPIEECQKGVQRVYVVAKDNSALSRVTLSYCHSGIEPPIWQYFGEAKIDGVNAKAVFDLSVAQLMDGNYRLRALCYDASGNESVAEEIDYLSDQTAPQYSSYQIVEENYQMTLSWQTNEAVEATIYRKNDYEKEFSIIATTGENSYTDTEIVALEPYTYYVVWRDAYGNETKGDLLYGSAKDVDTVAPEAYIAGDAMGMTGYEYILDGIQSTDNVHIKHYNWEISDGTTLTGAKTIHRFAAAGTYRVTLTVTDDSGNTASCSKEVTVIDRVSAGVVTVTVTDTKGKPIPYADVYLNLSEESHPNFVTDEKGVAVIKANAGTYQCAAYKSGYQAKECSVKVMHGEQKKVTLALVEGENMKVALSSRELTMQEILDYGINLNDPANHHVFVVEYEAEYAPSTIVYDSCGKHTGLAGQVCDFPMASGAGNSGGSGGGGFGSTGSGTGESGDFYKSVPVPCVFINASATVSWLKDMYEIKCDITNLANSSFIRLQDVAAKLNLPHGLSLATMAKRQDEEMKVDGDIGGMEQRTLTWVIRGDKPGVYSEEIYADISGRLMPFERSLENTAKLKTSIYVSAGKGLVILIQLPNQAIGGSICDLYISLMNEGRKVFHNVKFSTSAGEGEILTVDGSDGTEDTSEEDSEIAEVDMGDVVNVLELAPGMSVTAHSTFRFPSNLDDLGREQYCWQIINEKIDIIKGANLGVDVRVEYISARYTPNYSQYIVDDGLDGDPVRLSDGALIDELSFLDIQGIQEYGLTLEHDSNLANCEGDFGGGWYSNYSNYLSIRGKEVDLYFTPGSFTRFKSTKDSYWEKNKNGSYTYRYSNDASKTCTYNCLSDTIGSSYTLTRNKDTYTLTKRTGEKYYFDQKGNLTGIEDSHGRTLSVTLNGSLRRFSKLKKRKRAEGGAAGVASMVIKEEATEKSLTLEYTDTSYGSVIRRAYTNDGREASFSYFTQKIDLTPKGAVSKEKYYREINYLESISLKEEGVLYRYTYDGNGHITKGTDAEGVAYMTNTYDEKGRVIEQKDGENTATKYAYDTESEYLRTVTDITYADGSQRQQVSNEGGHIIRDVDERGNKTTYTYDKYGNQVSMTDALGASHVYEYNEAGDMTADLDSDDNQITMEYDKQGNVTQVTDAKGIAESYTYDSRNCLIRKTNSTRATEYSYNDNCQLIREETYGRSNPQESQLVEYTYLNSRMVMTVTRKKGSSEADVVQHYSYDAAGNIEQITDGEGNSTSYTYDSQGQTLTETIEGGTTSYTYAVNKEPSQITYADGSKVSYERNHAYQVEKEIYYDKAGAVTKTISYRYDKRGNLSSQCLSDGTGTKKHSTSYTYDKAGNLLTQTEEDGSRTVYCYDAKNRVEKQTDSSGISTSYTYYPNGKVSTEERRAPGSEGEEGELLQRIVYNYDRNWNLVETDDSISGVTSYTYDAMGQITQQRDGLGNKTSLSYDAYGNLIKSTDPRGNSTSYSYNSAGQCIGKTDPEGTITEYCYDKAGRNTAITIKEDTADKGSTTQLTYDSHGNLTMQEDASGHKVSYSYDKATGDVTDIKDSKGSTLFHYDYDSEGQLIKSTDSYGTVTTYQYDLLGNVTEAASQAGNSNNADNESLVNTKRAQSYLYDSMGRMIKATDTAGGITKAAYDQTGNMTALSNPEESKTEDLHTRYEYDSSNRLTKETNSIGMTVSLSYNAQQQIESRTDSKEQGGDSKTTRYAYDAIGRLTELTDKAGTICYEYDPCGNITTVTETKVDGSIQVIKKTYDKNNRISSITDANGNKICYTYNKYGSIKTLTYPDGSVVTYDTYDNGQLKSVTDWEGSQTSYEYDNDGRLIKISRPDGSTEAYEYNTAGKLTLQTDKKGEQLLQTISYTYNGYGEISKKVKTYGDGTKEAGKQTEEKVTDSSKDSNVDVGVGKVSDADSTKSTDTKEEMQYNTANQLISYQGKTIEYDAYGNMTKGPANGSMAAYTYDSRNRLTGVLNLSYEYDAENHRIASRDSQTGKTIRYIHNTNSDLSQLLVEEDGTTTTKYVYGNELISAKVYGKSLEELKQEGEKNKKSGNQQADISYYYHYDNLKSTTLLTDATGNVVETYDYGTYGEVTSGDTTLTRFLYNGGLGVSSDSNGLYYMRARYYNPAIRRFINQDVETGSMDDSASLNRYAYVQGNPISLTDPFGLSPDMEYGNYEANALKRLFKVADKVADYLPVVGTARDIKRSYNAFKNGNVADGIKHGATAALALAVPTAKLATKAAKTTLKLAKNALKAEKCISKTAEIATEGIKLAGNSSWLGRLANKAGDVSKKIAKAVKNGVSTVARTVKREAVKIYKDNRGCVNFGAESRFGKKSRCKTISYKDYDNIYQSSIHNAGKNKIMLGKYDGGGPTSYITKAGDDYTYFSLGNEWNIIKAKYGYTDDDMFKLFNEAFLDDGINAGKTFHFSHNPINDTDSLGKEYQYLLKNNYKWDAGSMTMKPRN